MVKKILSRLCSLIEHSFNLKFGLMPNQAITSLQNIKKVKHSSKNNCKRGETYHSTFTSQNCPTLYIGYDCVQLHWCWTTLEVLQLQLFIILTTGENIILKPFFFFCFMTPGLIFVEERNKWPKKNNKKKYQRIVKTFSNCRHGPWCITCVTQSLSTVLHNLSLSSVSSKNARRKTRKNRSNTIKLYREKRRMSVLSCSIRIVFRIRSMERGRYVAGSKRNLLWLHLCVRTNLFDFYREVCWIN